MDAASLPTLSLGANVREESFPSTCAKTPAGAACQQWTTLRYVKVTHSGGCASLRLAAQGYVGAQSFFRLRARRGGFPTHTTHDVSSPASGFHSLPQLTLARPTPCRLSVCASLALLMPEVEHGPFYRGGEGT